MMKILDKEDYERNKKGTPVPDVAAEIASQDTEREEKEANHQVIEQPKAEAVSKAASLKPKTSARAGSQSGVQPSQSKTKKKKRKVQERE